MREIMIKSSSSGGGGGELTRFRMPKKMRRKFSTSALFFVFFHFIDVRIALLSNF